MTAFGRLTICGALALVTAATTACAPVTVHSFTSRNGAFSRYRTYRWADVAPRATGDPRLDSNPFFEQRLISDAERELAARGFERMSSGTADLLLHYHANFSQELDLATLDRALLPCEMCPVGFVYEAGTIMLDFVDTQTNRLVWRAWTEGNIDGVIDDQRWLEEHVDQAISRIVKTLPRGR